MKRMLALVLSLVLVLGSTVAVCAECVYGDTDGNGTVEIVDATIAQRFLAKIINLDEETQNRLDVNGDGQLTVLDCTYVQQYVAHSIDIFPVENSSQETTEPTEEISYSTDSSIIPQESQNPEGTEDVEPTEEPTEAPTVSKEEIYRVLEQEILKLVNVEREKAGLKPLKFWDAQYECAKIRASEITRPETFSHTRPDGRAWNTVFVDRGFDDYWKIGENLALYFTSAEHVMYGETGWMNSPGHRANILNPDFDYIAIGVCESADYEGYYAATQLFLSSWDMYHK